MKLTKNRNFIIGAVLTAIMLLPVVVGLIRLPYEPDAMNPLLRNAGPSMAHLFGCDNFGRDIFTRVIEGAKSTFLIAVSTVVFGTVIGSLVGALTGYFGGIVDSVLMRINDTLASFPAVFIALITVSVLGKGRLNTIIALGISFIPSFARIMRGEFMRLSDSDYVKNARLLGASDLRIMFVHIFPNTLGSLVPTMLIGFNNAVLAEAGLGYLGLGVQPPASSLGRMLSEAQPYLLRSPWYAVGTGLYIILTVLGVTLIGESLGVSYVTPAMTKKRRSNAYSEGDEDKIDGEKTVISGTESENGAEAIAEVSRRQSSVVHDIDSHDLLRVRNLHVSYHDADGTNEALHGLYFTLRRGEILGIVGESGSGKSLTVYTVMGLMKENAEITTGSISFDGCELTAISDEEYEKLRGSEMSIIFQEPMSALNPVKTIGWQLEEAIRLHDPLVSAKDRKSRAIEALAETELDDPEEVYSEYPHQLSGGMRQRVLIAMAMINRPKLLIADEPTTALDAAIQAGILSMIGRLAAKNQTAVILVSHDLSVIRSICSNILVMLDGNIVEKGNTAMIFENPRHDYTRKLLTAANIFHSVKNDFSVLEDRGGTHEDNTVSAIGKDAGEDAGSENSQVILSTKSLNIFYNDRREGFFGKKITEQVCFDIDMELRRGEILGIVGESGSGKSSLVKCIAGLNRNFTGKLNVPQKKPAMVFQDPYGSLNPMMNVGRLIKEAIRLSGSDDLSEDEIVSKMLERVELSPDIANRRTRDLSGGQRQRVAIAMALAAKREYCILDEPVSSLDVTVAEQITDLLVRLREETGLSYLFISHDIELVGRICDRVIVLKDGRIVEQGKTSCVFGNPKSDYTDYLIKCSVLPNYRQKSS